MAILTMARHRFYNNAGAVNAGGKVYTYTAGTSTPVATYTSSSAGTPNANPIILDSKGECDLWITGQIKINVLESDDTQVTGWPVDNIGSGVSNNDAQARWAGTAGGSANALTITPSPSITEYVIGQSFIFKSSASANTTATTIAVSGLATIAVQSNGSACSGGEILASNWYMGVLSTTAIMQITKIGEPTIAEMGITATTVPNTPAGNIAATTVQAAINELDTEKAALAGNAAQAFSVAAATAADHAVRLDQLTGAPAFIATSGASTQVVGAALAKVTIITTEVEDNTAAFASSRFTPLVAGKYQISIGAANQSTSVTEGILIELWKNGAMYQHFYSSANGAAGTYAKLSMSGLVPMNGTTDYLEIYASRAGAVDQTLQNVFFSGALVVRT